MSSDDTKHVQTKLSEAEYEQFRELASERNLSLKEAGHEAVREWLDRQRRADPDDPAFAVLDGLDGSERPGSAATDARTEADLPSTWDGCDVTFTLADDPSTQS